MGAKNNDSHSEKWVIVIFCIIEYRRCGNSNSKNDSRPCTGASAILKSVDFKGICGICKNDRTHSKIVSIVTCNMVGDMPQPLYTFLEEYDFSGKTIIPFCSHGGSGFSRTESTIADLQPEAEVSSKGLSISRNDVSNSEDKVAAWVRSLGY